MRRKLAAGNWKMNGDFELLTEIQSLTATSPLPDIDVLVCPPATLLQQLSSLAKGGISTGGQDCHTMESGAHTGDISALMLKNAGASYVILGHSERRQNHQEMNTSVQQKANAAIAAGLQAVICLGESLEQREASNALSIIADQLAASIPDDATGKNVVVAYEPIWAIGTGKVATLEQIEEVHDFIRAQLIKRFGIKTGNTVRILYGGSVKAENAAGIFSVSNVDGALVGGASLHASDFRPIIDALGNA